GVDRALDRAHPPVGDHHERHAHDSVTGPDRLVGPRSHAGDARDDPPEADADRERGEAGPPPGEVGALVRQPGATAGVLYLSLAFGQTSGTGCDASVSSRSSPVTR